MKTAIWDILTFQGPMNNPIPLYHTKTAKGLALYLHRLNGCKVYYTGHSLGGGLATLMGAYIFASTNLAPAGIISFGSPPVGNYDFCNWFNEFIPAAVSWRFVKGDEFAPMAPPLPFTVQETARQFHHVNGLILVEDLDNPNPHQRPQNEMTDRLNELVSQVNLLKILTDHNIASTLRALRAQRVVSLPPN
jgi:pimeloyl-ACP methyl ester carboxylesterase